MLLFVGVVLAFGFAVKVWRLVSVGTGIPMFLFVFLVILGSPANADSNLATCLDGKYQALCNHALLSPSQLQQAHEAEHRANFATCVDGRYVALCRHEDLTLAETAPVGRAEHAANLQTCLDGRYAALCRHGNLTPVERPQVAQAEHAANLNTCLDGRYRGLCRHDGLSPEESKRVQAAEAKYPQPTQAHATTRSRNFTAARSYRGSGCESGHWIDSVMDDGSIVKLEDGSLWKVDDADTVDSVLWLPATEITVCDGKLINTDDNEKVDAEQIR